MNILVCTINPLWYQYDGGCVGGLPGHGPGRQLLCLQESLLRCHEEVVPWHIQGLIESFESTFAAIKNHPAFPFCANEVYTLISFQLLWAIILLPSEIQKDKDFVDRRIQWVIGAVQYRISKSFSKWSSILVFFLLTKYLLFQCHQDWYETSRTPYS